MKFMHFVLAVFIFAGGHRFIGFDAQRSGTIFLSLYFLFISLWSIYLFPNLLRNPDNGCTTKGSAEAWVI